VLKLKLKKRTRPVLALAGSSSSTQQGRHAKAMRSVATVTVGTRFRQLNAALVARTASDGDVSDKFYKEFDCRMIFQYFAYRPLTRVKV